MKRLAKWLWFLVAALFASAALAQSPDPRARAIFGQAELDQMLAPIALYPDSLLSQILMGATYPRDVAEAASWSRANGGLRGDEAVRAVERERWDPSVISLVAFPEILTMMDERRDWTYRLGDAFLDQRDEVMDTVQDLRRRADAAGTLRSSEEMVVQRQGDDYVIEPPTPEVVYVPYYDPYVAYGDWWWPAYQPVYWRPWSGYRYRAGYRGFGWGYGIYLGSGFFFGAFDWPRRYLRYTSHRPWYFHGRDWRGGDRWTHRREGGGDSRWRDYRDGRRDTGSGSDRRDWRGERRAAAPAPTTTAQQGFFPPRAERPTLRADGPAPRADGFAPQAAAPRNPGVRAVAPRYSGDGPRYEGRRQPEVQQLQQPRVTRQWTPAPQSAAPPSRSPIERPATMRAPVERHVAPAQAERSAPQRSAPVRSAPERSAPERSAPERSAPDRSPVERSSGRGGRER